jgi:hypothetical protein
MQPCSPAAALLFSFTERKKRSMLTLTYSHERYEPCVLHNCEWTGTVEEGFDVGAAYLE